LTDFTEIWYDGLLCVRRAGVVIKSGGTAALNGNASLIANFPSKPINRNSNRERQNNVLTQYVKENICPPNTMSAIFVQITHLVNHSINQSINLSEVSISFYALRKPLAEIWGMPLNSNSVLSSCGNSNSLSQRHYYSHGIFEIKLLTNKQTKNTTDKRRVKQNLLDEGSNADLITRIVAVYKNAPRPAYFLPNKELPCLDTFKVCNATNRIVTRYI